MKKKSAKNRTITLSDEERQLFTDKIVRYEELGELNDFADKTIHGDLCNVLKFIPDGFADLIIVDPPYNMNKRFGRLKFGAMSCSSYETYLRSWFGGVCRKLKPNGSLYMCGDWKCASSMQRVIEDELSILNRITWQREKGRGSKLNWKNAMEDIWFAVKDKTDYYFNVEAVKIKRKVIAPYRENGKPKDWEETKEGNFRVTFPSNFWDDISVPFWSMRENTEHPTQKPEKLYAKLILASSKPNDIVFDPFLGSGTASVVAKKLGRRYCGVEINEDYCLFAAKRLMQAENDNKIQGYKDNVFWERNTTIK